MKTKLAALCPNQWPVYWFARLEKAVQEGDHKIAAEAQEALQRLGVRVNYGRPTEDAADGKAVARG